MFKKVFLFLILAELLSIFAWGLPVFNLVCFWIILLLCLALSLKNLKYGIFIAFTELIIGSHGYLFSLNTGETFISIRMGIFAVVMLCWVVNVFREGGFKQYWNKIREFKFLKYYVYLAVVLLWGFIWGIIRGNDFGNVFLDFNNWLFFLYLFPILDVARSKDFWKEFGQVATATLVWLVIKTLILLYIFSHQFIWALPELYKWIRDTRVGEITMMSSNFYRIFIQSQIYCLIGFFVLLPFLLSFRPKRIERSERSEMDDIKTKLLLIGCLTTVIISFSRSFWMGLAGGLIAYCLLLIAYYRAGLKIFLKQAFIVLSAGIISTVIIFIIINLPPKISGENFASLISKRTTQIEAAGSSRINMLKPLRDSIIKHPVIGSGFGTTVTYKSVDPRILTTTAGASGEYTTYAFEWSYLDLLLKIGLAGVGVYLLLIFRILQAMWQRSNFQFPISNNNSGLQFGLLLALIALLIVNIFTPYLNHPLGIGFVILVSVFVGGKSSTTFGFGKTKSGAG